MNAVQNSFGFSSEPSGPVETLGFSVSEQPLARIESHGPAALSDGELLALIIAGNPTSARALALRILSQVECLQSLAAWDAAAWRAAGVQPYRAAQLAGACELGRRLVGQPGAASFLLNRSDSIAQYMQPMLAGLLCEKFWVLCLNRKNRLIKRVEITSGTATASLAHPREVFRAAMLSNACAIVCVHNHPSGDPAPSVTDVQATRQLREAARAVDIQLIDHVVCGTAAHDPLGLGYYSFREAGML